MKPATQKARALLAKLTALAERGINGERDAARLKLARLKSAFDFTAPDPTATADLFAGVFQRASSSWPILTFTDADIAANVKWAVEHATKIPCCFHGSELRADATPATSRRLETIAATIADGFTRLWAKFERAPGVNPADKQVFIMGIYDSMMNETRPAGQPLPHRATPQKLAKAKRKSLANAPGLNVHPYTVGASLGRQIRFSVPVAEIEKELDNITHKQLEAA